jgi:4-alpha-glucanotransferase
MTRSNADPDELASRYGIQRHYLDNTDQPAELDEDTIAALRAAIGEADRAGPGPLVIRPDGWQPEASGEVELESGERRPVEAGRPVRLPLGYHWLATGSHRRRLIVSPGSCVRPERRSWGWTAQLYATRSRASWGIGDFADLRRLTGLAAEQGAGFVLVNPLHAGGSTAADLPQQSSPYFPSSRRFFSPLYLAVPELPGAAEVLGSRLAELAGQAQAAGDPRIDRDAIWRVKHAALREIFDATDAKSAPELADWRRRRGQSVADFAAWCVLSERYRSGWPDWPAEARSPSGRLARQVHAEQPDDVAFACWLQWQAERQLGSAGATIAVLQDLPIGVDPQGADGWVYQDLLATGVTVGAPPDPFNRSGQDWGLPPFVPWRLRAADYQPFIEAIRATIAHAGGLRIDHVMGLFRLWWVPAGSGADRGGYVRYPASDLLDIVALESHRANAPVVGEDLGTVEPGVREELAERNVLSYRLLWFEQQQPGVWPAQSLAAVSTHDLPTVAGLWSGRDLADQQESGLDADQEATTRLRTLLTEQAGVPADADPDEAVTGAYRLLARAPSLLLAASLDDALAVADRPNMPGSTDRPNWRIPLPVPLEEFAGRPGVQAVAELLRDAVEERAADPG